MTPEDFENGRRIDLASQVPEVLNGSLNDANENGDGLYQGDMVLTPYQLQLVQGTGRSLASWSQTWAKNHWAKNGTHVNIPYKISSPTFTDDQRANIARAAEEYEKNTCIR